MNSNHYIGDGSGVRVLLRVLAALFRCVVLAVASGAKKANGTAAAAKTLAGVGAVKVRMLDEGVLT